MTIKNDIQKEFKNKTEIDKECDKILNSLDYNELDKKTKTYYEQFKK
jgi:hypothetical protein